MPGLGGLACESAASHAGVYCYAAVDAQDRLLVAQLAADTSLTECRVHVWSTLQGSVEAFESIKYSDTLSNSICVLENALAVSSYTGAQDCVSIRHALKMRGLGCWSRWPGLMSLPGGLSFRLRSFFNSTITRPAQIEHHFAPCGLPGEQSCSMMGYTSSYPGSSFAAAEHASSADLMCRRISGALCWSSHSEYCTPGSA